MFGWVTFAFVLVDVFQVRLGFLQNWEPQTLPKLVKVEHQIPRARTVCELVFLWIFGVWWVLAIDNPFLVFGPAAAVVTLGPIWHQLLVPMVVLMLAGIALHVINFARPYWTKVRLVARVALNTLQLALLAVLLSARPLAVAASTPAGQHASVVNLVEYTIVLTLVSIAVATLVEGVKLIARLLRLQRNRTLSPNMPASAVL